MGAHQHYLIILGPWNRLKRTLSMAIKINTKILSWGVQIYLQLDVSWEAFLPQGSRTRSHWDQWSDHLASFDLGGVLYAHTMVSFMMLQH